MPLRVHIHEHDDPVFLQHLKQQLDPEIELTVGENVPDPADYEILICGVPDRSAIEASSRMTTLVIPWAGLPMAPALSAPE